MGFFGEFLWQATFLLRDVMTKNPRVVIEDTNMREVIATSSKYDINSLIFVQNDKPVVILTIRDALFRGWEFGLSVNVITAGW
jgi:CBS domain-containing protein